MGLGVATAGGEAAGLLTTGGLAEPVLLGVAVGVTLGPLVGVGGRVIDGEPVSDSWAPGGGGGGGSLGVLGVAEATELTVALGEPGTAVAVGVTVGDTVTGGPPGVAAGVTVPGLAGGTPAVADGVAVGNTVGTAVSRS